MQNAELKKQLIESGTSAQYRKTRSMMLQNNALEWCEKAKTDDELAMIIFGLTPENVIECERIRNNALRQRNKIEDHLRFLIQGNWTLYFLTLTFSDDCLQSTTFKTRHTKITRLLSSFCDDYILNVDFGKENEREHYHAIVAILDKNAVISKDENGHLKADLLDEKYRYGFYQIEQIRTDQNDVSRLSRYITKLTMHSVKVKQTYVSVKKNSPYQRYKKIAEMKKEQDRGRGLKFRDFEEEMTFLLSGYYEGTDA